MVKHLNQILPILQVFTLFGPSYVKMSTSKEIYKNDFMSIESTLNVRKVSTFKVLNVFGE